MQSGGKISEWNEGAFKAMRLHELQRSINLLKMDPLGRSEGKFHYVLLLSSIDGLYGEGASKYSGKEKEEVDKIRYICYNLLKFLPPHKQIINDGVAGKKTAFIFNSDNFEKLMNTLDLFERRVKALNDDHGLTTKNKGAGGLF